MKKRLRVAYKDCDFLRLSETGWGLRLLTIIVRSQQVDLKSEILKKSLHWVLHERSKAYFVKNKC